VTWTLAALPEPLLAKLSIPVGCVPLPSIDRLPTLTATGAALPVA